MRDSDQATLRRALSSLLERLEGPASTETEITSGGDSIVVIFLGRPDAGGDRASHGKAFTIDNQGAQTPHPGLEKFPIAETQSDLAPKTCFMEPGRACVKSGACEMRGY